MSKKNARWRKLDNAAKLYSAASNKKDTRVFRFYCELKEEVNPKALQEALNQTIETFPTFSFGIILNRVIYGRLLKKNIKSHAADSI